MGTANYLYLTEQIRGIRPGQTYFGRFDSNTHIRRRDAATNTQVEFVDTPEIFLSNDHDVWYYADPAEHIDHSESHIF